MLELKHTNVRNTPQIGEPSDKTVRTRPVLLPNPVKEQHCTTFPLGTFPARFLFWGRSKIQGQNMLFDERPKEDRRELFGRDREVEELKRAAERPLVVLTGIRRIGKTSVLKVALKEMNRPSILIDARGLGPNYGKREFYGLLAQAIRPSLPRLADLLRSVRGVKVLGMEVVLVWKREGGLSLVELFDRLNERKAIIAVDEAQKLRGPLSTEIKNAMAHAYDYDRNLTFILTGSEVGLLWEFLGTEDPESPLYGRYIQEITLERFTEDQSVDFLRRGFEEVGRSPDEELIRKAVEWLDGIPGWLTYFGNACITGKPDLEEIKRKAVRLALGELKNLLSGRPERYKHVLRAIAEKRRSWTEVKRFLEEREGSTVSSSVLQNIMENLQRMSLIRDYSFLDPIYEAAAGQL